MPWKGEICHTGFSSPPEGEYWIWSCSLHLGHKFEIHPYLPAIPCQKKGEGRKEKLKKKRRDANTNFLFLDNRSNTLAGLNGLIPKQTYFVQSINSAQ